MKKLILSAGIVLYAFTGFAQTEVWNKIVHPDSMAVNAVAFTPDGQKILTSTECDQARIKMFEASSGNQVWAHVVDTPYMCLMDAAFTSNSNYFAITEEMGYILIFNNTGATPVMQTVINTGSGAAFKMAISPGGSRLAVNGFDDTLRIYSLPSGNLLNRWVAHTGGVTALDFRMSDSLLATGGNDNKVKLWNPSSGALVVTLNGHSTPINALKWSPDNIWLISTDQTGSMRMWHEMGMGMWMAHYSFNVSETIHDIDVSDDAKYMLLGGETKAWVYKMSDQSLAAQFNTAAGGAVLSVDFQPAGINCAIATETGFAAYFNMQGVLGINEKESASNFVLYPNPSGDEFVFGGLNGKKYEVTIYAMNGTMVRKIWTEGKSAVSVRDLSPGSYTVQINDNGKLESKSLIVK